MTTPHYNGRPLYSDVEADSDSNSESSHMGQLTQEAFIQHFNAYERESTYVPQLTVGFGTSLFGPRPEDLRVANTGADSGNRGAFRLDLQRVFRFSRGTAAEIFRDGYQPRGDTLPSSLQRYQAELSETGLVSTTRDPSRTEEAAMPAWVLNSEFYSIGAIDAPGGYEFLTSLGRSAYANQQEVAFWKGIRPEFVAEVTEYRYNRASGAWQSQTFVNPNAHAARAVRQARVAREAWQRNNPVDPRIAAQWAQGQNVTDLGPAPGNPYAQYAWNAQRLATQQAPTATQHYYGQATQGSQSPYAEQSSLPTGRNRR
jgi:hypothetical protein